MRSTPPGEHRPVMLQEVLDSLDPQPGEIAVDATLGLGGHAAAIATRIGSSGKLIGVDWDSDNLPHVRSILADAGCSVALHHGNFAGLPAVLAAESVDHIDLLVADLGMSSMQLDDAERGFSYVRDGPLDMRMDRSRGRTAAQILATISAEDLARALVEFGDEPHADEIARAICDARAKRPLIRTGDLIAVIGEAVGEPVSREAGWRLQPKRRQWKTHPAARAFQAIRMLVNRELGNLQELLRVLPHILGPGGRAAIISFHSGEDRLVKNAFRAGLDAGHYAAVAPEPLRPSEVEKNSNPRARSARLRWAKRMM